LVGILNQLMVTLIISILVCLLTSLPVWSSTPGTCYRIFGKPMALEEHPGQSATHLQLAEVLNGEIRQLTPLFSVIEDDEFWLKVALRLDYALNSGKLSPAQLDGMLSILKEMAPEGARFTLSTLALDSLNSALIQEPSSGKNSGALGLIDPHEGTIELAMSLHEMIGLYKNRFSTPPSLLHRISKDITNDFFQQDLDLSEKDIHRVANTLKVSHETLVNLKIDTHPSDRLFLCRIRKRMSLNDLANASEIPRSLLAKFEKGKSPVSNQLARRLARILDCQSHELETLVRRRSYLDPTADNAPTQLEDVTLGEVLYIYRQRMNISQEELGWYLSKNQSQVSRDMSDDTQVTFSQVQLYAEVLHIPPEELFTLKVRLTGWEWSDLIIRRKFINERSLDDEDL
jgi:transcriptional regulator with XRE-family HTH domain